MNCLWSTCSLKNAPLRLDHYLFIFARAPRCAPPPLPLSSDTPSQLFAICKKKDRVSHLPPFLPKTTQLSTVYSVRRVTIHRREGLSTGLEVQLDVEAGQKIHSKDPGNPFLQPLGPLSRDVGDRKFHNDRLQSSKGLAYNVRTHIHIYEACLLFLFFEKTICRKVVVTRGGGIGGGGRQLDLLN